MTPASIFYGRGAPAKLHHFTLFSAKINHPPEQSCNQKPSGVTGFALPLSGQVQGKTAGKTVGTMASETQPFVSFVWLVKFLLPPVPCSSWCVSHRCPYVQLPNRGVVWLTWALVAQLLRSICVPYLFRVIYTWLCLCSSLSPALLLSLFLVALPSHFLPLTLLLALSSTHSKLSLLSFLGDHLFEPLSGWLSPSCP